ncbi:hypothetical protein BB561_002737 [Smittium simulii]|uniref:AB hydrolase-1 domain-containing protein n=1 Tax=Smittium simulii TaxID=133385 RepID=A0A2T9YPB1_9FUNG|nr:hypothetical protein BB561_002737 [Smittium simulii]
MNRSHEPIVTAIGPFIFSMILTLPKKTMNTLAKTFASASKNSVFYTKNSQISFPCLDKLEQRENKLKTEKQTSEELFLNFVNGYNIFNYNKPFVLSHGGILPSFKIAFETWGTLNADKSNAILIHTGLSASSHAKSHPKNTNPGWWEKFIGPGLSIDTNKYFVICTNVLGGCYGSTGPSSFNPNTGKRYASNFPIINIYDFVRAQFLLLSDLGIDRLHASVGASMGGMQSLAAAKLFPDRVNRFISISACALSHPYSISLRYCQRQVLLSDPNFNRGNYYDGVIPHVGMKLARQISTITYRSGPEWELRFGRNRSNPNSEPSFCPDYLVETYLDHKSERFCFEYDANSLLYISKAMDMFDVSASNFKYLEKKRQKALTLIQDRAIDDSHNNNMKSGYFDIDATSDGAEAPAFEAEYRESINSQKHMQDDLVAGLESVTMPALIIGVQTDILFPSSQQKEMAKILKLSGNKSVTYYELDSLYGHDTFLIDLVNVGAAIKGHLDHS